MMRVYNVLNATAFGDKGIPLQNWVMIDLGLLPSAFLLITLPRTAAEDPRQIFPPPITIEIWTPRLCTSLIRSAISRTTEGEMFSREPRSWSASPLNLSTTRL